MVYYTSTHLPESGGQLLITSLTYNKKIVASSNTDIVLPKEQLKLYSMTFADKVTVYFFQNNNANIIIFSALLYYKNKP